MSDCCSSLEIPLKTILTAAVVILAIEARSELVVARSLGNNGVVEILKVGRHRLGGGRAGK